MSRRMLLDHYGIGFGTMTEIVHVDSENPGDLIIEELEDVEPIIEMAKRLSEQTPGREMRHAAFIPAFVFNRAYRQGWLHDASAWKRWANDPNNRAFRTWPGRL